VLAEDETIIRLFPPLRYAWTLRGQQALLPISGRNDQRTLFGAINVQTGHRLLMAAPRPRQGPFQNFLRLLRRHYRTSRIYLLLDKSRPHRAGKSQAIAQQLDIELIWLPTQAPHLNAMDHLWKELKKEMLPNHQFEPIERAVDYALGWIRSLSTRQALRKAGLLSEDNWLKHI
jgi:transposase